MRTLLSFIITTRMTTTSTSFFNIVQEANYIQFLRKKAV
jgi:hypothetical protein